MASLPDTGPDPEGPDPEGPAGAAAAVEDAVKVYGSGDTAVRALDGVTVAFSSGRLSAVMGSSGSGKSTLLHCLAGLDRLTEGRAVVGDTDTGKMSDRELTLLRRERVGFVFQAYNLVPTLTARENVTLPLSLGGRTPDPEWLDTVVDTLGLRARLDHRPAQLSGGEQQRVAVARALLTRPEIILADEPTGNLDSRNGAEVLGFLRRAVSDLGQTVVMVTHDASAAAVADRVVFLADRRLAGEVDDPSADELLDAMKALER